MPRKEITLKNVKWQVFQVSLLWCTSFMGCIWSLYHCEPLLFKILMYVVTWFMHDKYILNQTNRYEYIV